MGSALWSVILAGGEGERMQPLIRRWQGRLRPKQYCAFVGARSLFQHTVDRSDRLVAAARRVSVVAESHREEVAAQLRGRDPGTVLHQPANRGTAAGLLLAVACVRHRDPDARLVVFPSDHFVHPEAQFLAAVRTACRLSDALGDRLVVLGARPRGFEPGCGWIVPGAPLAREGATVARAARRFVEKPDAREAARVLGEGDALLNTLVLVARAQTLWRLASACVPELTRPLARLARSIGTRSEVQALERVYSRLDPRDFSTQILQVAVDSLAVVPLEGVLWSDWGVPERVLRTARQLGLATAFAPALAACDPDPRAAATARPAGIPSGGPAPSLA